MYARVYTTTTTRYLVSLFLIESIDDVRCNGSPGSGEEASWSSEGNALSSWMIKYDFLNDVVVDMVLTACWNFFPITDTSADILHACTRDCYSCVLFIRKSVWKFHACSCIRENSETDVYTVQRTWGNARFFSRCLKINGNQNGWIESCESCSQRIANFTNRFCSRKFAHSTALLLTKCPCFRYYGLRTRNGGKLGRDLGEDLLKLKVARCGSYFCAKIPNNGLWDGKKGMGSRLVNAEALRTALMNWQKNFDNF